MLFDLYFSLMSGTYLASASMDRESIPSFLINALNDFNQSSSLLVINTTFMSGYFDIKSSYREKYGALEKTANSFE